jgi:hypothetical protein
MYTVVPSVSKNTIKGSSEYHVSVIQYNGTTASNANLFLYFALGRPSLTLYRALVQLYHTSVFFNFLYIIYTILCNTSKKKISNLKVPVLHRIVYIMYKKVKKKVVWYNCTSAI